MNEAPRNPTLVLLAAIFPGGGHLLQGRPQRGLVFLFFMVILGWVSIRVMPETFSFFGRHAGGIFIYGISVLDAYKWSKVKFEDWKRRQAPQDPGS
jgi:hypothetical protein